LTQRTSIRTQLRAQLLLKGVTLTSWALEHGYLPNFVTKVVSLYCGGSGNPRGEKTLEVIKGLETLSGVRFSQKEGGR
jgi:hypothetical protein